MINFHFQREKSQRGVGRSTCSLADLMLSAPCAADVMCASFRRRLSSACAAFSRFIASMCAASAALCRCLQTANAAQHPVDWNGWSPTWTSTTQTKEIVDSSGHSTGTAKGVFGQTHNAWAKTSARVAQKLGPSRTRIQPKHANTAHVEHSNLPRGGAPCILQGTVPVSLLLGQLQGARMKQFAHAGVLHQSS